MIGSRGARGRPAGAVARLAAALASILLGHPAAAVAPPSPDDDLAAARALFEANLDAIRRRDRQAYLDCYLRSDTLARAGIEGFLLGFDAHAKASTDDSWPDLFEALDLRLASVRSGLVYGAYRYRVRYGPDEQSGLSERLFVKTEGGWRIAMTSAFAAPEGTPPPPRALVGATLVDGTGAAPVADAVVILRGGRIECAGGRARCPVPGGVETIDMRGLWVTPGLVDAHVHFAQTGWADGRPDSLDVRDRHPYEKVQAELRASPERFFGAFLCSGVTAVFDVGGYPWTWGLRARAESDTRAPHVEAAGPLLSTRDHWLNLPGERQFIYLSGAEAAREGVAYLAVHASGAAKVWFLVTERPFEELAAAVAEAGRAAKERGLPLIAHATGLREAKEALRAGARLLVHSVWDRPVDEEFLDLARRAGAVYCPTLIVRDGYTRLFRSVQSGVAPVVDDPGGCVDSGTLARVASTPEAGRGKLTPEMQARLTRAGDQDRVAEANLARVRAAGIPVAMGTDAGNPLTLHGPSVYAEMEAMQAAGLTPLQVLAASTSGGAQAMGRLKDLGTVEAGKIADLLVVGSDPTASIAAMRQIRYVVRGGVVRSAAELRAPRP